MYAFLLLFRFVLAGMDVISYYGINMSNQYTVLQHSYHSIGSSLSVLQVHLYPT